MRLCVAIMSGIWLTRIPFAGDVLAGARVRLDDSLLREAIDSAKYIIEKISPYGVIVLIFLLIFILIVELLLRLLR